MKPMLSKLKTLGLFVAFSAVNAIAAPTPTVPSTALETDYALFDWVFAGVVATGFVFMVARRVKGFVR